MNERKLRILYLTNIPSPYRIDFFNEIGKSCELTVLFERRTSSERDLAWHKNNFNNFEAIFLKGININKNNALCIGVIKFLRKELYDIIIVGGYSTPTGMLAIEILRKRKIPFILNTDGGMIKKDHWLKHYIKKHYISCATYWLSTGKQTTEYLLEYGAKGNTIFVYPFTSVLAEDVLEKPTHRNIKNQLKEKLNITEEKVILSVGQFVYRKGFDLLLKACEDLPKNIGIYIVGGEPIQEYLELKNKLFLTNVHFVGYKSKIELTEYYMASDLFVLPTREDIWGLVINEAMAHGLPVITTNKCVAGQELVIENENGFIVPVNDSEMLAIRMNQILEDEMLAESMSVRNLSKTQEYTIENMAVQHLEIFESILSKKVGL